MNNEEARCGDCKDYFRCEMYIAEDSTFAEQCALFRTERMTSEQAIAHGREQLEIFGGEHRQFIELAIEALEKQIPKKPDRTSRPYRCSVCGSWNGIGESEITPFHHTVVCAVKQ